MKSSEKKTKKKKNLKKNKQIEKQQTNKNNVGQAELVDYRSATNAGHWLND